MSYLLRLDRRTQPYSAYRSTVADCQGGSGGALIPENKVFFLETKPEKIAKIAELQCDVFIDDLPEILLFEGFPAATQRFLFSATPHTHEQWTHTADWKQFHTLMQAM